MEQKKCLELKNRWKDDAIAVLLLGAFAFFINRGIEIKGLYMDDLYLWSCYGEQSFWEFNFPVGSTRFRFLYYLMAWVELALVGNRVTWFVPINIVLNILVAAQVYWFGKKLAKGPFFGFLSGVLYLLSRMAYYQIGQVYGLMETAATSLALGILILLYQELNGEGKKTGFYWACGLYFAVCFVHERYLALLPLFYLTLLLGWKKESRPDWKKWLAPLISFGVVMAIRAAAIGSVLPAGTGGTEVADTFSMKEAVGYAVSQVAYIFGINAGPEHLNGMAWSDSPRWIQLLVYLADLVLLVFTASFFIRLILNWKTALKHIKNSALFLAFIALCIGASSVTVRVEMRWIYVSYTAALMFLCYMCGALQELPSGFAKKTEGKLQARLRDNRKKIYAFACGAGFCLYLFLMFPVESFYRGQYPNLYFWPNQLRYNSLAEETYEKYGDEMFGKTIYIVGNTYEMSRFTADTFFKVFDQERKAEGTQVVFIDSILDVGQVTDDMLMIREEPEHNKFQDITGAVRSLKCEIIDGYYRDGWMDEEASIRVMAGKDGTIHLKFMFPGVLNGGEVTAIYRNGELEAEIPVTESVYCQDIPAEPYQIVELEFKNNFYMQNAQEQRGKKRLAVLMEITAD